MADDILKGIQIRFDGMRYSLWKDARISMSVDDLCATIQFNAANIKNEHQMPVTVNTVFDVLIDDELVTTGRPDMVRKRASAKTHDLSIEARSLGRELVDCQCSQTLSGLRLAEIVKRLCNRFKVPVKINTKTSAVVPKFALQSESPSNALINAVRSSNLILYPLPDGGLILTEPTSAPPVATLEYGKHFTQYEIIDEYRLRYSEYLIKSYDYDNDTTLSGKKKDSGLSYYRPMHVIADRTGYGLGSCQRRAELEHNRRLARAHRISIDLSGWHHPSGIWWGNQAVRVVIPHEEIDEVKMTGDVTLGVNSQGGRVTNLQVMNRDAFASGEIKKSKRKKRSAE